MNNDNDRGQELEPGYSAMEVARLFGVCKRTVQNWARAGKLKGVFAGQKWYFTAEEIRRAMAEGTRPGDAEQAADRR